MPRIDAAEIRSLVTRTRADDARWQVDGRRFRLPRYLLRVPTTGGPELARADEHGRTTDPVRARIGLLPRGRALHALARAVERQVIRAERTATRPVVDLRPNEGDDPASEVLIDLAEPEPVSPEESPAPSPRSPSGRSEPSDPDRSSGRG